MTRTEWIAKWRNHLAGKLALGTSSFRVRLRSALSSGEVGSTDALGEVMANLGQEVDQLLGKLWDDLQPKPSDKGTSIQPAERQGQQAQQRVVGSNGKG